MMPQSIYSAYFGGPAMRATWKVESLQPNRFRERKGVPAS
jgi:hypothetical protein